MVVSNLFGYILSESVKNFAESLSVAQFNDNPEVMVPDLSPFVNPSTCPRISCKTSHTCSRRPTSIRRLLRHVWSRLILKDLPRGGFLNSLQRSLNLRRRILRSEQQTPRPHILSSGQKTLSWTMSMHDVHPIFCTSFRTLRGMNLHDYDWRPEFLRFRIHSTNLHQNFSHDPPATLRATESWGCTLLHFAPRDGTSTCGNINEPLVNLGMLVTQQTTQSTSSKPEKNRPHGP